MIELNTDDLKNMILSPDAESRRLGFNMIFGNIKDIPPTEITSFKDAYSDIIDIRTNITGGLMLYDLKDDYKKTHHLSHNEAMNDCLFVFSNICNDVSELEKVFPSYVVPIKLIKFNNNEVQPYVSISKAKNALLEIK